MTPSRSRPRRCRGTDKSRLRSVKHYEETQRKIDRIKERYEVSTAAVVDVLVASIGSVREMDELFGYKRPKRKVEKSL